MKKSVLSNNEKRFKDFASGINTPLPPASPPMMLSKVQGIDDIIEYFGPQLSSTLECNTNSVSAPINTKVGKRRTCKHKDTKKKARSNGAHNLWKFSSPHIPRPSPTAHTDHITDYAHHEEPYCGDDALIPEAGLFCIEDTTAKFIGTQLSKATKDQAGPIVNAILRAATTLNLMAQAETWSVAIQTFYLYVSGITRNGQVETVIRFCINVLGHSFAAQADIEGDPTQSPETTEDDWSMDWLSALREMRKDWSNVKVHPLFCNITKLFAILCYTGVVNITEGEWSEECANAFFPESKRICNTATSSILAMLDVTEYVAAALHQYRMTGDFTEAFGDSGNIGIAQELARLEQQCELFRNGNLFDKDAMDGYALQQSVSRMCTRLTNIIASCKSPQWLTMYLAWSKKMETYLQQIDSVLTQSPTRHQPYAIYLDGPPGQGKSHMMQLLCGTLLTYVNGEYHDTDVYTRMNGDAYWSKAKSDVKAVCFDDLGASLDNVSLASSYDEYLRTVNVSRYRPPMAEASEKGEVEVKPDLVIGNGNGVFPGLGSVARTPGAFARRVNIVAHVKAKPEFCTRDADGNFVLSSDMIQSARMKGELGTERIDDVCDIYVFDLVATATGVKKTPIELNGKHVMSIKEFLFATCLEMKAFLSSQKVYLESVRNQDFSYKPCSCGSTIDESVCICTKIEPTDDGGDTAPPPVAVTRRRLKDSPIFNCTSQNSDSALSAKVSRFHNSEKKPKRTKNFKFDETLTESAGCDAYTAEQGFHPEGFLWSIPKPFLPEKNFNVNTATPESVYELVALAEARQFFQNQWSAVPHFEVPEWLFAERVWKWITPRSRTEINKSFSQNIKLWTACVVTTSFGFGAFLPLLASCAVAGVFQAAGLGVLVNIHRRMHHQTLRSREMLHVMGHWRKINLQTVFGISAAIVTACQLLKFWFGRSKGGSKAQGYGLLDNPEFREMSNDVWSPSDKIQTNVRSHLSKASLTTGQSNIEKMVSNNLYRGNIYFGDEKIGTIQGMCIEAKLFVVCKHYVSMIESSVRAKKDSSKHISVVLRNGDLESCHKFKATLNFENAYMVPNKDLVVLHIPELGSRSHLAKHLPLGEEVYPTIGTRFSRSVSGALETCSSSVTSSDTVNVGTLPKYLGINYIGSDPHYTGLCGAPIIQDGKSGSHIIGFHSAGSSSDARTAIACRLTKSNFDNAVSFFTDTSPSFLSPTAESDIDLVAQYGNVRRVEPHFKSPLNFIDPGHQFEVFGVVNEMVTPHSQYSVSPISESISIHCGVDNVYVTPKFRPRWFGPQKTMEALATPGEGFPDHILSSAVDEYLSPLLPAVGPYKSGLKCPLTDFQVINGAPYKYMSPMKKQTTMGFPFQGKKITHLLTLDPEELPPGYIGDGYTFDDEVMEHYHLVDAKMRKNQRVNFLAKACSKDEVVTKEKCRTIYVGSAGLTMIGRKYFLPVVQFLQMKTIDSECAVGLNCFGPESELIYQRVRFFGGDRIIAGDFSKYDARLPVSILQAALKIMIKIASTMSGYQPEDLTAMNSFALELASPTIDFFGDVINLSSGGHISGNPLTAVLNSIANSLLLRCVYYTMRPPKELCEFRDHVALLTYGDDNLGSVSSECDFMDMVQCKNVLGERGIGYTSPDKDEIILPFYPAEKADFLKRDFNRQHETGCHLGALDMSSIFKPLHMINFNPDAFPTPEMMSIYLLSSALDELFNHGKLVYERRRSEFIMISNEMGVPPSGSMLQSFEDKLANWELTYGPQFEWIVSRTNYIKQDGN